MYEKEFILETVTPLFMSGADTSVPELRAPAIKGQLRWWWRALNGYKTLAELKDEEEKIFGSTNRKSSFAINVKTDGNFKTIHDNLPSGKREPTRSKGKTFPISIIDYLAFGIAEYDKKERRNVYKRPHVVPGSRFRIAFRFFKNNYKEEVIKSLQIMARYGGLGAKSRNGFGSVRFMDMHNIETKIIGDRARYGAFSSDSRVFVFNRHQKWVDALVEIGRIYRQARLYLEPRHQSEKRVLVAKPYIDRDFQINDRHAKPFFLHVDKNNDQYQGKILFMPYQYYNEIKRDEYNSVMDKVCGSLEKEAQEVTDVV